MKVLSDIARLGAKRFGPATAIVFGEQALSYNDIEAMSNRYAARLHASGVRAGDAVALLMENSLEYPVAVFSILKLGAVLVPLNFRYRPDEVAFAVNDTGARLLIAGAAQSTEAHEAARSFQHEVRIVDASREGLLAPVDGPVPAPAFEPSPDAPAMVMYTSGTTGFPKGAVFSHAAYMAIQTSMIIGGDLRSDDTLLVAMPLFHSAGLNALLMPALLLGAKVVIASRGFHPESILALVARHRVSVTMWVPTMLAMLVESGEVARHDLSSLRKLWYGSSPIAPDLLEKMRRHFSADLYQFYGMTETGMTAVLGPRDHEDHAYATGRELFNAELRIVDSQGQDVPVGGIGEIISRQWPLGMIGYLNRPQATEQTVVNGWIRTGDLARNEGDGLFTIVDRIKDMLISGAENIYPSEIEHCIAQLPGVLEVAVFGVPDPVYGESVCAAVVRREGAVLGEEDIVAWCAARIAPYKKPKRVVFMSELPKTSTGKVTKHVLRAPFWSGQDRSV